jgi:hypothetical protein
VTSTIDPQNPSVAREVEGWPGLVGLNQSLLRATLKGDTSNTIACLADGASILKSIRARGANDEFVESTEKFDSVLDQMADAARDAIKDGKYVQVVLVPGAKHGLEIATSGSAVILVAVVPEKGWCSGERPDQG